MFDGTKLFLGEVNGERIGIDDDRHAMMVAGSRAGKGQCVIIPTLLEYVGSALVIDPKAELASITARRRGQGGTRRDGTEIEGLGQEVAVLDPFGIGASWLGPYQASFNPMLRLEADSRTMIEDASAIADSLIVRGDGKDPHWDESALNFVQGIIVHVATHDGYEENRNLVTVHGLLARALEVAGEETEPALFEQMLDNEAGDGFVQNSAANFYDKADGERSSVLSNARAI